MIAQRQAHQMPSRKILLSIRQIAETREYQRVAASRLADLPTGPLPAVKRQQQLQQSRRQLLSLYRDLKVKLDSLNRQVIETTSVCRQIIQIIDYRRVTAPLLALTPQPFSMPTTPPSEEVGELPADAPGEYIRDDGWIEDLDATEIRPATHAPRTTRPLPKLPSVVASEQTQQTGMKVISHFPPTSKHLLDGDSLCVSIQAAVHAHMSHFEQRVTVLYMSRTYLTFFQSLGYQDCYWDDSGRTGLMELRAGHELADEELLCVSETGENHVAQTSKSPTHL